MMIYIEFDENRKVTYRHLYPFHDEYGLGKTEAELLAVGILVESIPTAEQLDGKDAVLMVDDNDQLYYEYVDRPLTADEELAQSKQAIETLTENLIDFKIAYMSVPCQSHQDYPVLVEGLLEGAKSDGE